MRGVRLGVAILCVAAVTAACSGGSDRTTTASKSTGRALSGALEPSEATAAPGADGGATTADATAAPGATQQRRSTKGASSSAPAGAGTPAKPGAALVRHSQGVTDSTVRIGAVAVDWGGLQNVKGFNVGDPVVQVKAVRDYVNARGGIAGRKVEVTFAHEPASTTNWESDEQQMCTTFTEDQKVFAVMYGLIGESRTLLPCLARKNTPLISSGGGQADLAKMKQFSRHYFYPSSINLSRLAQIYVDGLAAQGFFDRGSKVGLVRPDNDAFRRATEEVLKPRLAAHGMTVTREAVVQSQNSVGNTASQMPNVVLRFQQAGINRVLFLDDATLAPLFVTQAGNQGYSPRYGFASTSNLSFFVRNVPASALSGAIGIGWMPAIDIETRSDVPTNAARDCDAIMAKAGQSNVDPVGVFTQRGYCDEMFFLKAALDGGTDLTPEGLLARVGALGSSYQSPQTYVTKFVAGRQDGLAAIRNVAFNDACKCFRYTSAPRPVS